MKKVLLGVSLLTTLFSTASIAASVSENDYAGLRAGAGYSNTEIELGSSDTTEEGFKVELGYDINRMFGLNVSYETINGELGNVNGDIDGYAVKAGVDFGYAFYSKEAFLKPYVALGGVSYSQDDFDESSVYGGLGVRFQYHHFYSDLGISAYYLDAGDTSSDDYKFYHTAITFGYKF
ncbi:outer membrane beta-barrel protein [Psychromonas sp. PT13]|uniref:outer membrane beta-barrel protein n=1 Tax=Psychromonas sp. PT13 TaxID=3439547 RepID=UPI003EBBBB70